MASEHPSKRPRLDDGDHADPSLIRVQRAAFLASMSRNVSPPPSTRGTPDVQIEGAQMKPSRSAASSADKLLQGDGAAKSDRQPYMNQEQYSTKKTSGPKQPSRKDVVLPSPLILTKIQDLPASSNVDTVSLHDILGNPLIREAWVFNFCFDVDWMMQFFDPDIRDIVQVKIIHGSWRNEDSNKIAIDDACRRWKNVEAFKAYLPDQFGTHHSKMFVLFTHDDQAEVVIHTANMLQKDWTNMTQAAWRTGRLSKGNGTFDEDGLEDWEWPIGSGPRFKHDLLAYLNEYKKGTQSLRKQLQEYDFSRVRGALVASAPSKFSNRLPRSSKKQHLWGYPHLREALQELGMGNGDNRRPTGKPHLVAQVSSIATIPKGWLEHLLATTDPLFTHNHTASFELYPEKPLLPTLSIIYPTAPNVANSLDGYAAGGSIHTKAQSTTHINQINSLRPYLCQWTEGPALDFAAGRDQAAPHIKTYIQYNQQPTKEALEKGEVEIEWALLTSANLSVQAWGRLVPLDGDKKSVNIANKAMVHVQSFEIGVLVWPELFGEEGFAALDAEYRKSGVKRRKWSETRMVPVFGKNIPDRGDMRRAPQNVVTLERPDDGDMVAVGLRMPYDLPLTPYAPGEMPWSPQGTYMTPDSKGRVWGGH